MLLNRTRAIEIMERENLDGLVAVLPVNFYYLSDYWGLFNTAIGYDAAYIAVLPRDEQAPPAVIVPALELRRIETKGSWIENIYPHSSPADGELLDDGTIKGTDYTGWPARPDTPLGDLEQRWVDIVGRLGNQSSADAFQAITRALKAAGLDKANIGTDDPRLRGWLESCGLSDVHCHYRVDLFNEIRLIKTPDELELLTTAAGYNEHGLLTAANAMAEGATWLDIENVYMATMAAQGARGVYLMCGVGELPHGEVRRNEPVLFDALGQYKQYHGDFGRCVVLGEPSAEHRQRHAAICSGWDAAQEHLKPGVRYSELAKAVGDVVRGEGFAGFRDPIVHSLGLEHTDDPKPPGVQPQSKPDQVLQTGMVVNVDMPHTEIGWGSVHMEDTVVITGNGFKRLASADFTLRVID